MTTTVFTNDILLSEEQQEQEQEVRVDSAVHQLASKQDLVYTNRKDTEEYNEWTLALFDGHGTTNERNPYSEGRFEKCNLTLSALQDIIETHTIDDILARDIFSTKEDPALALQREFGKICLEKKISMTCVGATMVLVKVKHEFSTKKIIVEVLSVGDSTAIIHQNGEKVLQTVPHDVSNEPEIDRLKMEGRITDRDIIPARGFEMLDEDTLCSSVGKYVQVQDVLLSMTQSMGHVHMAYGEIMEQAGIFGLDPYKARIEFEETDKLNIKLFSDGVSDMMNPESILHDQLFLTHSNATETAELAKNRWEKKWKVCSKDAWMNRIDGEFKHAIQMIGADDVSCISWIKN